MRFIIPIILSLAITSFGFSQTDKGVVVGRVVTDQGRPIRGAQVQALKVEAADGKRKLTPTNTTSTNDRGEFRLFWLEPDTYYLVVNLVNALQAGPLPGIVTAPRYFPSQSDASFTSTYFPGTFDIERAQPIRVGPGELDVHAIEMAVLPSREIRGRVIDADVPDASTVHMVIKLESLGDSQAGSVQEFNVVGLWNNGEFDVRAGVAPGAYRLNVHMNTPIGEFDGKADLDLDGPDLGRVDIPVSKTK